MDKRFVKNWVLHISHRLRDLLWMVRAWSSIFSHIYFSQIQLKVITSFWHTFLTWMNPMIMGGHSMLLLLPLQDVMHSGSSHSSTIFSNPSSKLCSYLQIAWSRNQTSLVSLGNTLVVQVDPLLNKQWSSWPWSSSSCVRLWGSSPSRNGTSSCRCPIHLL